MRLRRAVRTATRIAHTRFTFFDRPFTPELESSTNPPSQLLVDEPVIVNASNVIISCQSSLIRIAIDIVTQISFAIRLTFCLAVTSVWSVQAFRAAALAPAFAFSLIELHVRMCMDRRTELEARLGATGHPCALPRSIMSTCAAVCAASCVVCRFVRLVSVCFRCACACSSTSGVMLAFFLSSVDLYEW
jgi:hypothetical protein